MGDGGEAVDDRDGRRGRKTLQRFVRVRAHEDGVDVPREDASGVLGRLARTDHELTAAREEGVTAELRHADLEGNSRPQTRLFEEHPERLAAQERLLIGGAGDFEMRRDPNHERDFRRAKIGNVKHVTPHQAKLWSRCQHHVVYLYIFSIIMQEPRWLLEKR